MYRRKILSVFLSLILILVCISACQAADPSRNGGKESVIEQAVPETREEENIQSSAEIHQSDSETAPVNDSSGQMTSPEHITDEETMIYAHIGNSILTIRPESNSSAEAFVELLQDGDITIDMHDYGGFEKVGPLGRELPTNDERITTEPGDVILYQGNQITIYYDKNTWSFTRLGKVQGMSPEEIRATMGNGDPTVIFSLKA